MRGCAAHGFFPLSQGLRTRTRARHIPLRRRGKISPWEESSLYGAFLYCAVPVSSGISMRR